MITTETSHHRNPLSVTQRVCQTRAKVNQPPTLQRNRSALNELAKSRKIIAEVSGSYPELFANVCRSQDCYSALHRVKLQEKTIIISIHCTSTGVKFSLRGNVAAIQSLDLESIAYRGLPVVVFARGHRGEGLRTATFHSRRIPTRAMHEALMTLDDLIRYAPKLRR